MGRFRLMISLSGPGWKCSVLARNTHWIGTPSPRSAASALSTFSLTEVCHVLIPTSQQRLMRPTMRSWVNHSVMIWLISPLMWL